MTQPTATLANGQQLAYWTRDAVMDRLGPDPELDYVRLNISARKPVGGDGD